MIYITIVPGIRKQETHQEMR